MLWYIHSARQRILSTIQRTAASRADNRIVPPRNGGLGQMVAAIDSIAQRLVQLGNNQNLLVGSIAHEVSTALARMSHTIEIQDDNVRAQAPKLICDMNGYVQQLLEVVNGCVEYWEVNQAGSRPLLTPLRLSDVVESAIARERAENAVHDVPGVIKVWGNEHLLEQAIVNLIRNALRHAEDAPGPVEVRAESDGDLVRLQVMDRGRGVPEPALLSLGQPFFRAESAGARRGHLGIGLWIVKDCIAACNGKVLFRNRKGGGFEVQIVLQSANIRRDQRRPRHISKDAGSHPRRA